MSSSSAATRNVSPRTSGRSTARRSAKTTKLSKVVTLRLPPAQLARFASPPPSRSDSPSHASTPAIQITDESPPEEKPAEAKEPEPEPEPEAGPKPKSKSKSSAASAKSRTTGGLEVPTPPVRDRSAAALKAAATRRLNASLGGALPRIRAKPGPKRKGKGDDPNEPNRKGGNGGTGSHKLGPKANQGAINAGLRALDRSGKPCRRWEKKKLQLKSFTGVCWEVPTWRSPRPVPITPEADSAKDAAAAVVDAKASSADTKDDNKENKVGVDGVNGTTNADGQGSGPSSSSAKGSNSNADGDPMTVIERNGVVDSPGPVAATPA
ncbi:MAG: hypothetical protein M1815_002658 [Lichina confinis]|nr:MAG: hypothetical protein M1815_002658 [Lichina confinis]